MAPPALYLEAVAHLVRNGVVVSAQNAWSDTKGAFTGEIRYGGEGSRAEGREGNGRGHTRGGGHHNNNITVLK